MARNEELSVYGIPGIYKNRYYHPYTTRRKTTGNIGGIYPIYNNILVQPGDTVSMSLRSFFRMTTSLFPSMDNIRAEIFAFAQDWQNDWDHTKEFWGEDLATPFEPSTEYTIPQVVLKSTSAVETDDIMHHLALPPMEVGKGAIDTVTRVNDIECERLSYNTYIDIYNNYFRDQSYIAPIEFSKGDEDIDYESLPVKKILTAARYHDYFAGTPNAQKGEPERLPLGTEASVYTGDETNGVPSGNPLTWTLQTSTDGASISNAATYGIGLLSDASGTGYITGNVSSQKAIVPNNLMTDLTTAVSSTINALRLITATQHIKEELMWYGNRFQDIIYSQWGIEGNNAGYFRIPEFLGSISIDINMDTVLQTSSTDAESPQGNAAGYSVTFDDSHLFTKSFTTWQNIMVLCVIRISDHSYGQGIANQHLKKRKYDFYWDEFAGLGAQPRSVKEIALTGTDADDDTWNFAPAWREYTSEVDRVTGLMVPGIADTLANYTYTDEYASIPNAGEDWINENPAYVDRTLVVPHTTTDQFMMDFVFDIKKTSIIPNYRLPGLDKL